jgi:hypothetical protein
MKHHLFTAHSLLIPCPCTADLLPIRPFTTDSSIHCLFTAYSLPIHCLSTPMHCLTNPLFILSILYAIILFVILIASRLGDFGDMASYPFLRPLPIPCLLAAYSLSVSTPMHCLTNPLFIFAILSSCVFILISSRPGDFGDMEDHESDAGAEPAHPNRSQANRQRNGSE